MTSDEDRIEYCKYCGLSCVKLVSTTKENSGRVFFACPTPRFLGGHGWMEWVDRIGWQYGGRYQALELVLKDKDDRIVELEYELAHQKTRNRCLTKVLKGLLLVILVLSVVLNCLYEGGNASSGFELPECD